MLGGSAKRISKVKVLGLVRWWVLNKQAKVWSILQPKAWCCGGCCAGLSYNQVLSKQAEAWCWLCVRC